MEITHLQTLVRDPGSGNARVVSFKELKAILAQRDFDPKTEIFDKLLTQGEWWTADNLKLYHQVNPRPAPPGPILQDRLKRERRAEAWAQELQKRGLEEARNFPKGLFGSDPSAIAMMASHYMSRIRSRGHEPLRDFRNEVSEAYRFVWLSSWTGTWITTIKSPLVPDPDRDGFKAADITEVQWQGFRSKILGTGFWHRRAKKSSKGCDGADWLFEGIRDGEYHAVVLWSPCPSSRWYALGTALAQLNDWPFKLY